MGPALQCGSYSQWHSVGETGLAFPSRYQLQITSWEGVGFCVHLSLLLFNFVPVEEEKRLSRGLGASSANYQGLITYTECSLVTCWLGIRKSSSHKTRLSINLSALVFRRTGNGLLQVEFPKGSFHLTGWHPQNSNVNASHPQRK